jgi:hypothetical protein
MKLSSSSLHSTLWRELVVSSNVLAVVARAQTAAAAAAAVMEAQDMKAVFVCVVHRRERTFVIV